MTTTLMQTPKLQFFSSAGVPLSGGRLYTYAAGTTTPLATYVDSDGFVPNANPIILNSRGECNCWAGTALYKLVLRDSTDTLIWSVDNVTGNVPNTFYQTNSGGITQAAGAVVRGVLNKLTDVKSVLDFGAVGDGSVDDTAAITAALVACRELIIPPGYSFKITSYINIPSNTTIHLLGTLQLTNRASGLYSNTATNISIYGYKIGKFTDTTVQAGYVWTPSNQLSPAVHLRYSIDCLVDGCIFTYVNQGVLFSALTTNTLPVPGGWVLSGTPYPTRCVASNNVFTYCEMNGLSSYLLQQGRYEGNYVYRCGDGGMWMMGATGCEIINNVRASPATTAADCTLYGTNILAHPTTWNDQQGIELENCFSCLVKGNIVSNFAHIAIDIKNNCSEIDVVDNMIYYSQSCAIAVRQGETANPTMRISVVNNDIFNLGTSQYPDTYALFTYAAGIYVAENFLCDVSNNRIHSWQNIASTTVTISNATPAVVTYSGADFGNDQLITFSTSGALPTGLIVGEVYFVTSVDTAANTFQVAYTPGGASIATSGAGAGTHTVNRATVPIRAVGPAPYMNSQAAANPVQAAVTIQNNKCWFKLAFQETVLSIDPTSTTPPAIVVGGQYDTVAITGNLVKANRFYSVDTRYSGIPAILLTYIYASANTNPLYYPQASNITGNTVSNWIGRGIDVIGYGPQLNTGAAITGNTVSGCGDNGIRLKNACGATVTGNTIANNGGNLGTAQPGVALIGDVTNNIVNVTVCSNNIFGREQGGANNMNYGISTTYASGIKIISNVVISPATAVFSFSNQIGSHECVNTTGFPRSGAGNPTGSVAAFFMGETYYDTAGPKWYIAPAWNSTAWLALTP